MGKITKLAKEEIAQAKEKITQAKTKGLAELTKQKASGYEKGSEYVSKTLVKANDTLKAKAKVDVKFGDENSSNIITKAEGKASKAAVEALNKQIASGYGSLSTYASKTLVKVDDTLRKKLKVGAKADTTKKAAQSIPSSFWQMPITFQKITEGNKDIDALKLPFDPIVSLSGKNIITRRYVNKSSSRGTIKERWCQDDLEITISGLLSTDTDNFDKGKTVLDYEKALRDFCEAKQSIPIVCEFLNSVFGISSISIESYELPFTAGTDNQTYTIKAYSDDNYTLLVDKNTIK